MLVEEKELRRRYDAFSDEVLLRIVTAERMKYRPDALAAAEKVLAQRGVVPPPEPFAPAPLPALAEPSPPAATPSEARPKSPYGMLDLLVDLLLFGFVYWAMKKLDSWTEPGGLWAQLIYLTALVALFASVGSLRQRWRSIEWRD